MTLRLKNKSFFAVLLLFNIILYISQLSAQVLQQDSLALIAFYDSTNGDTWANNSGWKSGPVSTWHGIGLTDNRVTSIVLTSNGLSGKLPSSIEDVSELSTLYIGHNSIGDTLPSEIGNLTYLVNIDISSNGFSGDLPFTLGNLSNLEKFYADHNNFNDSIPAQIGNLSSLLELDLSYNQLAGSIPPELGDLSNITFFYLSHNQLSGNIPQELGRLSTVTSFNLSYNQLDGSIPDSLGNLNSMATFDLSNNQLSGNIPSSLGNIHSMGWGLLLHNNQLTGSIPSSLGNVIMQNISLYNNQLTGNIPSEIGNISNLIGIYLQNNQLSGSIPASIYSLPNLQILDLSYNQIEDNISKDLTAMPNLYRIYLNNNQLTGTIPPEFGTAYNIQRLWLNNNQLGDSIPVELARNNHLTELYLQDNNFSYMPDMSHGNLHSSIDFKVENNFLDFEDLEPNADLSYDFTYSPQAVIGEQLDTLLYAGDSIALSLNAGGTSSVYHWYKDSVEYKVISDTSLALDNVQIQNAAKYYCEVTNTIATELTISSRLFTLTVIDTTAPGIPQNLSATAGDSMIALSWSPNNEPDSIYYRIYMDTTSNPLTLVDSTSNIADTTKIFYGLNNNINYYFRLTAVDWSNNESGFSDEVYAMPVHIDSVPPAVPQNLSAIAGDSTISLTWNMVNDPDSIYYRVYMDTLTNPVTLFDSTLNKADTSIVINNLENNTTYYCRLTAVDGSNNESGFSNEVYATPVHIDSIPPAVPQNLSVTAGDSTITLTWNMVNDPDSIFYRVYMDTLTNPVTLIDSTLNNADTSIVIDNLKYNTTYYCRLTAVDKYFNESDFSNEVQITLIPTDINDNNFNLPTTYSLKQNYPNPFNPITMIEYQLPKQNHVTLNIYNMLGQKVANLVAEEQPAGTYKVEWNANGFASGIYYYQLISGNFNAVRKMILIK